MRYLLLLTLAACSCSRPEVDKRIEPITTTLPEKVDRKECLVAKLLKSNTEIWGRLMSELAEDLDLCNEKEWNELMYWAKANDNLLYDDMRNMLVIRKQIECTE